VPASFVHPQCQYFSAVNLLEESGDTLLGVDIEDGLSEEGGDAEFCELFVGRPLRRRWDGVEDDALFHLGVGDAVVAGSAEEAVGRKGEHTLGALVNQNVGSLAKSAGSVDHVINDDAIAVLDLTDEVHLVNSSGAGTLLDDHGEANIVHVELVSKALLELLGTVDTTGVRTYNDGIVEVLVAKVVDTDDATIKVIHGNARSEEALDLTAVQIDSNNTVNAHGFEKASDVGSRDGDTGLHLTVLSGIAVVGNDDGNATGTGTVQSGDHEEKLHEVVVDRRAGGLDDVNILSTDILVDHNIDLSVGEAADGGLAEVDAKDLRDLEGEAHVAVTTEELEASGMPLGLGGGSLEASLLDGHVGGRMRNLRRGGGDVGVVVFLALVDDGRLFLRGGGGLLVLLHFDKSLCVLGRVDGVDGHGILEILLTKGHTGSTAEQSGGSSSRSSKGRASLGAGAIITATSTCRRSSPGCVGRRS